MTRDGWVSAADALAILTYSVGLPLPAGFEPDPDGDVLCEEGASQSNDYWDYPLADRITANDALAVLRVAVDLPLPGPSCLWFSPPPGHEPVWETSAYTETVMGVKAYPWVQLLDTVPPLIGAFWPLEAWTHENYRPQALMRAWSTDPSVLAVDSLLEWSVGPRVVVRGLSPGTTQLVARWFDRADTLDFQVLAWEPVTMDVYASQLYTQRGFPNTLQETHPDTLVVGDSTYVWARAHDDKGFSQLLASDSVTWTSRTPTVATVGPAGTPGILRALAPGTTWVVGSWQTLADSTLITVLSDAQATQLAIASGFFGWWVANHSYDGPAMALSVASDAHTSSWRNSAMFHVGQLPRRSWGNAPDATYGYVTRAPWDELYLSLLKVADGLAAMDTGLDLGDNDLYRAYGKFVQGLSLGTLGLLFDQAFVVTETTDRSMIWFESYPTVIAAALASLDASIAVSESASFTVPSAWVGNGGDLSSAQLAQLAHGYKARFMAYGARTQEERAAADWGGVLAEVAAAHTWDFAVYSNADEWYDALKWYASGESWSWGRVDYMVIGPSDSSGQWQSWLATAPGDRTEFVFPTPDRRIQSALGGEGLYMFDAGGSPFDPARGTYFFSRYGDKRWRDYGETWVATLPDFPVKELEYLRAEGLWRMGDLSGAMAIVNGRRTTLGELPAWTDPTAAAPGGGTCVPKLADGSCGTLWDALKYEKRLEVWQYGMGTSFFDSRGWGDLEPGTFYHFPVPGSILAMLAMPLYTFGGDQPWMAPARSSFPDPVGVQRYFESLERRIREGPDGRPARPTEPPGRPPA